MTRKPSNTVTINFDKALTSGQVAKMFGVSPSMTVKFHKNGLLKGYTIPGSNDRRFYLDDVLTCMRKYGMRIPPELSNTAEIVQYGCDSPIPDTFGINDAIDFGVYIASSNDCRAVILGTGYGIASMVQCLDRIRQHQPQAIVAGVFHASEEQTSKTVQGLDLVFVEPINPPDLVSQVRTYIRPHRNKHAHLKKLG